MNPFALIADILLIGSGLFAGDMPKWLETASVMSGENIRVQLVAADGDPAALDRLLASGRFDRAVLELPPGEGAADEIARIGAVALETDPAFRLYVIDPLPAPDAGDPEAWQAALQEAASGGPEAEAAGMEPVPMAQAFALLSREIGAGAVPGIPALADLLDGEGGLNARGRFFAAMVLHGVLNGTDPTGLPAWLGPQQGGAGQAEGFTPDMAVALQRLAWRGLRAPDPQPVVPETAPADDAADAEAAPVQAVSELTGVTRQGIAFNLTAISDWSTELPFLDLFKTARPWIGHLPGQWGGFEADQLRGEGWLDDHGWPRAVPQSVTALSTLILTDLPPQAASAAGRYELRYRGSGRIELEGRARRVHREPGVIWFSFTPGEGAVQINILQTDPEDPIRDISVIREDRVALARQGEIFNPDFLARLRGAQELRFMPWMNANTTTLSDPRDRPLVTDATWAGPHGVPVEVMVALANQTGADPWFTIPHLASDELARDYARIVRNGLAAERRAIVEFSNEVWNFSFPQSAWADEQARAVWGARDAWVQYGAHRAARIADIWTEEFGTEARDRLVRVIGTHAGWQGLEEDILNAPAWRRADPQGWRAPHESFDAYAITGYFGPGMDDPERVAMYKGWMAESLIAASEEAAARGLSGPAAAQHIRDHRFDQAFAPALAELHDGSVSGRPEGSVRAVVEELFPYHKAVADRYGLELVMYEGGTHVVGLGASMQDEELTEFLMALNYAPGIEALYDELIAGWRRVSDNPFNDFNAIERPSRYGSWGTLRWLDDDNPRWRAVAQGRD